MSVFAFPSSILVTEDSGWIPEAQRAPVVPSPDEGQIPPRDNHVPEATAQWMSLLILHFAELSLCLFFWTELGKSYSHKSNSVKVTILYGIVMGVTEVTVQK